MKILKKFFILSIFVIPYSFIYAQWPTLYHGIEQGTWNWSSKIAVDNIGNSYVTGYIQYGIGTNDYRIATVSYGPTGNQRWATIHEPIISNNGGDYGTAIAVDPTGQYVYVTGFIRTDPNYSTITDFITIRYNNTINGEEDRD